MHATAKLNAKNFFDTYVRGSAAPQVVDIGAQDVTGSLREVCPEGARYVGVDFVAGRGVDVVLDDPYRLPFADGSLDVVVSSSCFEHSEMFWLLFLEIQRVLKPAGLFYLNVPSNGNFHRYPVDCWRFYPDSGNALAGWARRNGMNTVVLESFVSRQGRDLWNDYVCVFLRDEAHAAAHPRRITDTFGDFTNGMRYPDGATVLNATKRTEDQEFLGWKLHKRLYRKLFRQRGPDLHRAAFGRGAKR
jgi:SAM-dependent methyltransferase